MVEIAVATHAGSSGEGPLLPNIPWLFLFGFSGSRPMRCQVRAAVATAALRAVNGPTRHCSTWRQVCTAGSDLAWTVTNLQQAPLAGAVAPGVQVPFAGRPESKTTAGPIACRSV